MTNQQVVSIYEQLLNLRARADVRFPARISFAITHNLKLLEPIVMSYHQTRDEVILNYGVPAEDPGMFTIPDANIASVNLEFATLDATEVAANFLKIRMADIENMELSLQDMEALYDMIEEEG